MRLSSGELRASMLTDRERPLRTALHHIGLRGGAARVALWHLLIVVDLGLLHVLVDVLNVFDHVFVDARVARVLQSLLLLRKRKLVRV